VPSCSKRTTRARIVARIEHELITLAFVVGAVGESLWLDVRRLFRGRT
jgi:hypothetical protein